MTTLWSVASPVPALEPPAITFADVEEAFAARTLPVQLFVRIGGVAITATEATTRHSVDRPVGTCTVYTQAPRPASVTMNAEIEIEMGYPGAVRRTFHGFIPSDESVTDMGGNVLRIEGAGWASRLAYPEPAGVEIAGPVSLKDAFRSLCAMREIPTYLADDTTYVDGVTPIMLGGNDQINAGHVRFDDRTDPLAWLTRVAELYGYRVFDAPDGSVRLKRVSGLPPDDATSLATYAEGVNAFRLSRQRSTDPMATYIEVLGARYTDSTGGSLQIRSIPDEVPYAEELDPPGYRKLTVSNQEIVTDTQAAGVRNVYEVDRSEVWEWVSWEYAGRPDAQPGDVVTLTGTSHGLSASRLWLMGIDQSVNDQGYIARMEGWAGAGEPLAAGNDCVTQAVTIAGDGVAHLGDETLSHYKDPSPDGTEVTISFTVTDADYSSLRISGRVHGSNSVSNTTAVEGSKIEVWQRPDPSLPESGSNENRRVGSIDLPTANEELSRRRNYSSSNTYWQSFDLPLPGTLKEGAAQLKLIAGEHDDDRYDDYEIKDLELTYCGVGEPSLPGEA
jgi:hypothetical protein